MSRRKRAAARRHKKTGKRIPLGRRLALWAGGGVLLAGALGVLTYFQILSYLQGESFRENCAEKICNKAQAESCDIPENLNIDGGHISLPALDLERKGWFNLARLRNVSADIVRNELFDRFLHCNKLAVEQAELQLDLDRSREKLPKVQEEGSSFLSRFITPIDGRVDQMEVKSTDIRLKAGKKLYTLNGARVTATPLRNGALIGPWRISIADAKAHIPFNWLQDCSIKSAELSYLPKDKLITLEDSRLILSPGELHTTGHFRTKDNTWAVKLRAQKADVARLLSPDWKKRLTGRLYGSLNMAGKRKNITEAQGEIHLKEAQLEGLPILSDIRLDGTRPYRSLLLEKASCTIHYPYEDAGRNLEKAWLFDNINIEDKRDLLRVRGHVIVGSDGALGGTLRIGLPRGVITGLGIAETEMVQRLFNAGSDDTFMWLNMNLSGTVDDPQQDLTVRLSTLMQAALPGMASSVTNTLGGVIQAILPGKQDKPSEQETQPAETEPQDSPAAEEKKPKGVLDAVKDTATGILDAGLKTIF